MGTLRNKSVVAISLFAVCILTSVFKCKAQMKFGLQEHQIVEVGNGVKVEILRCVGEGEDEECECLEYSGSKINGTKKWIKAIVLRQFMQAATNSAYYNLEQCFAIALDRNISVKQAENSITSSILDRKSAQYGMLPSVGYNIGHYFSFGKNIDPVTNVFVYERFSGGYTGVGLQLDLFGGFSRVNTIKQSAYLIKAAEYAKKKTELELLTNVTLTYARLLLDKEQLLAVKANMQNTVKQLAVIDEKIKVGRLTKYEAYTFNARLNNQRANLIALQNDSAATSQTLKQLMNLPYKALVEVEPIDSATIANIYAATISPNDFIETILQKHPEIKQAEMVEEAAMINEKIARSSFYPSLSIGGNVSSNYNIGRVQNNGQKVPLSEQLNNNLGQNININLRIPIFSQMENSNRIKKEKINILNAQMARQEAENTVVTNTLELVNTFNAAKQRYAATLSSMEENILSHSLYEEKYQLGQVSSVEMLASQDILNGSIATHLQAKLQMFFQYQIIRFLTQFQ